MKGRKIIKGMDVALNNCGIAPDTTNGVETLVCKQRVEIDYGLNRVSLTIAEPEPRVRNTKWFEIESPYGKIIVMSRKQGASIALSLNAIEMSQYHNAVQLLGQQFQTALCMAIVKMCKSNINIQPDEN